MLWSTPKPIHAPTHHGKAVQYQTNVLVEVANACCAREHTRVLALLAALVAVLAATASVGMDEVQPQRVHMQHVRDVSPTNSTLTAGERRKFVSRCVGDAASTTAANANASARADRVVMLQ
jgi:hypothetical protein